MSVALELPAITISLPISERVLLKASLSTQNPKILIRQNRNRRQSNIRLTLTELARLNQTIQILFNLYAFKNHVNLNDFIFDGNETERPLFQFNCGCCSDKIECNLSFLVLFFHYFMISAIVFFSIAYLAFAKNSSLQNGIIAILSTCIDYLVPKGKQWISAFARTLIASFPL